MGDLDGPEPRTAVPRTAVSEGVDPPVAEPRGPALSAIAASTHFVADRWFRPVAVAGAMIVMLNLVCSLVLPAEPAAIAVRASAMATLAGGGFVCLWTGFRHRGVRRTWRLFLAAMLLPVVVASVLGMRDLLQTGQMYGKLTDASLVFVVPAMLGLAGLLLYPTDPLDIGLPGRSQDRHWYVITILDAMIVVGALTLLGWVGGLEGAFAEPERTGLGLGYYLPLTVVCLLLLVAVVLMAAFRLPRSPVGLGLLGVGLLVFTGSFMILLVTMARGMPGMARVFEIGFTAGPLLVALATLVEEGDPPATREDAGPRWRWLHMILPYLALAAAGAVALGTRGSRGLAESEEIWVVLALLVLALIRQMTTMADNIRLLGRLEDKQRQLRYQVFHDPLTGLANRALFGERLAQALAERDRAHAAHTRDTHDARTCVRGGTRASSPDLPGGLTGNLPAHPPGDRTEGRSDAADRDRVWAANRLAVLFCDLDGFKYVNDTLGHAAGDELLRVVARRLLASVRSDDVVARFGGDEFAVLLTSDADDPQAVGRRLAESVRAPIRLADTTYAVQASVGLVIADLTTGPVTAETLLHQADLAMYAAKARGKGQPTIYRPEMSAPGTDAALRSALVAAVRGDSGVGELSVVYRPVVDLDTRAVTGYEAQLSWTHPQLGTLIPVRMLPPADIVGLTPSLDRLLLRRACAEIARLSALAGRPLALHVSVTAARAGEASFVDEVLAANDTAGLQPGALVLHVCATRRNPDLSTAAGMLERLRAAGPRVCLSQVGAFDTAVDALALLPVDMIRLHPKLTALWIASPDGSRPTMLAHAFLRTVLDLDLTVIAGGVDDERIVPPLRERGCHLGTGDLFG